MSARVFVVRPEDRGREWLVARNAFREVCQMADTGKPVEVRVKFWKKKKTTPQNSTLWMWHTQVASHLTERCRESGMDMTWSPEDVHESIFKPRFMPQVEKTLPDGEIVFRPMGTSDEDATVDVISDAMEHYLSWIYGEGMEVTIPIEPGLEEIVRRAAA